jgi:hypothetical protein
MMSKSVGMQQNNKEANGSNLSHIVANAKQNAALALQPSHLRNAELKCESHISQKRQL